MKLVQKILLIVLLFRSASCVFQSSSDNLLTVNVSGIYCFHDPPAQSCSLTIPSEIVEPFVLKMKDADWQYVTRLDIYATRRMRAMPIRIFEQFPNVIRFDFFAANITILQKYVFIGAAELRYIYFQNSGIETIEANTFSVDNMPQLNHVTLTFNRINSFRPNAFNGSTQIRILDLGYNQLVTIEKNDFNGLTNLRHLDLDFNKLESIEDGALNFRYLKHLSLANNQLQELFDNTFVMLPRLKELVLDNNFLIRIGASIYHLRNLRSISLYKNFVHDLDFNALLQLPKLTSMYLKNSGLKSINSEYMPGVRYAVETLDVAFNAIPQSDILMRLRNCANLVSLYVEGNNYTKLDEIERVRDFFPKLEKIIVGLQCNNTEIESLRNTIQGLYISYIEIDEKYVK